MGTTVFNGTNAYTGCDCDNSGCSCTTNKYVLEPRSSKARMITVQEASVVGCRQAYYTCPRWMRTGDWYWTMS